MGVLEEGVFGGAADPGNCFPCRLFAFELIISFLWRWAKNNQLISNSGFGQRCG